MLGEEVGLYSCLKIAGDSAIQTSRRPGCVYSTILMQVFLCTLKDGMFRTWCSMGCDECLHVGWCWSIFGFVGEHQYLKSDVGSYRKSVEGVVWENLGRLRTSGTAPFWIRCRGVQGQICQQMSCSGPEMTRDRTSTLMGRSMGRSVFSDVRREG